MQGLGIANYIVFGSVAVICIIMAIVLVCSIRNSRNMRRILSLGAKDFHDIYSITRKNRVTRDLNAFYIKAKKAIVNAAKDNYGKTSVLVVIGHNLVSGYGQQFEALFLEPLVKKLESEGFSLTYYPNGQVNADSVKSSTYSEPTIEISWNTKPMDENEAEPEPEKKTWEDPNNPPSVYAR